MIRNVGLVEEIDELASAIDERLAAFPQLHQKAVHFQYVKKAIEHQVGWEFGPKSNRPRQSRRRDFFEALCGRGTLKVLPYAAASLGPILTDEGMGFGFFGQLTRVETIFGFSVFVSAEDNWRYMAFGVSTDEPAFCLLFDVLLPLCDYVVDVGSNIGFYSLLSAAISDIPLVVAIEPSPVSAQKIREAIAVNQFEARVFCEQLAISDSSGEAELFFHPCGSGGHSIVAAVGTSPGSVRVETATLGDLRQKYDLKGRGCIKIDVEGAEDLVLAGARSILSSDPKPFVIYESWHTLSSGQKTSSPEVCFDILHDLGYDIYNIKSEVGHPMVSLVGPSEAKSENFFAVPPDINASDLEPLFRNLDLRWVVPESALCNIRNFLRNTLESLSRHDDKAVPK